MSANVGENAEMSSDVDSSANGRDSSQQTRTETLNLYLQQIISEYLVVIPDCRSPEFTAIFQDGKKFTYFTAVYFMDQLACIVDAIDGTTSESTLEKTMELIGLTSDLTSGGDLFPPNNSSLDTKRKRIAKILTQTFIHLARSFDFEKTIEVLARLMERQDLIVHIISEPKHFSVLFQLYKSIVTLRHEDVANAVDKYTLHMGRRKRTQSHDIAMAKSSPDMPPVEEKRRSMSADNETLSVMSPRDTDSHTPLTLAPISCDGQTHEDPSNTVSSDRAQLIALFFQCCRKFDRFFHNIIKTPSLENLVKKSELTPALIQLLVTDSDIFPEENFNYRTTLFKSLMALFKHGIDTGICDQLHKKKCVSTLLYALKAPPAPSSLTKPSNLLHSSLNYKNVSYVVQLLVLILEESQHINFHLIKTFQNAAGYRTIQDALIDHQERFDESDDFMIKALRASARLVSVSDKFSAENHLVTKQVGRDELDKSALRNAAAFHALSQTLLKSHHITFQQRLVDEMLFFIAEYGKTSVVIHQWHPVALYIKNLDSLHDPVQDAVLKLVEFMIAGLDIVPREELVAMFQLLEEKISAQLAEKVLSLATKILHLNQEYLNIFREVHLIDVLVRLFASKFQKMRSLEQNSVPQISVVKDVCTDVLVELLRNSANLKFFRDLDAVTIMQDLVLSDFCRGNAIRIFQTIIVNDTIQNQVDVSVLVELLQSSSWSRVKLKTSIFNGLLRILQYNDSAKDAFAEGGFVATVSVIINSQWKEEEDLFSQVSTGESSHSRSEPGTPALHELNNLFEALFKALTAALCDHFKNKITFVNQVGECAIVDALTVNNIMNTPCAKDILQYVLDLGTERCFKLNSLTPSSPGGSLESSSAPNDHFIHGLNVGKNPILHNPFAIQIIFKLLQKFRVIPSQSEAILMLLDFISSANPYNLEQLGSIATVEYLLTNHIDVVKDESHPLHSLCMNVIDRLACYKMSAKEWRMLFGLLKNPQHPESIMKVLSHAARAETYSDTPFVEYLENSRAMIVSLDERPWPPAQGYTFMAWVYIQSVEQPIAQSKKANNAFTMLMLRSDDGRSNLEIGINTDSQLILNTHTKPKFFVFSDFSFEQNKWYHLAITHSKYRILHSPSTATLYVNGRFVQTQKVNYLGSTSGGGLHVRGEIGHNTSRQPIQGAPTFRLGPTLFYEEVLTTDSIPYFFIVGRNYMGMYATSRILKHSDQAFSPNYVALFDVEDRSMSREEIHRHNLEMSTFVLKRVKLSPEKLVFCFNASMVHLFDLATKKGSSPNSNLHKKSNALFLQNIRNATHAGKPKAMLQGNVYCCTPRSLSNDILLFDGIKLIFALIERAENSSYLLHALDILQNLMYDCNDVIQEVNRLNGSKIIALFLSRKALMITTDIVDTIWKMTVVKDSHDSEVMSNKHTCKCILFDNEIWRKTSAAVQVYLYKKIEDLLKDPLYPDFNAARLKNMGIVAHLTRVLIDAPPLDAVVQIVEVLKRLLMHNASPDDMIPLTRFLSFSLVSDGKPLLVQKDSFLQPVVQPSTRFSRTHRSQISPAENVVAARNLILRMFLELTTDETHREHMLDAFGKHLDVRWFTMFLIKVVHPSTMVLLMNLWAATVTQEKVDTFSHLWNQGLIEYSNQRDVYRALLALHMDVTFPAIADYFSAHGDPPTFSTLLKSHLHFSNFQVLPVVFTLLKYACKNSSRASFCPFGMHRYMQQEDFTSFEKKFQAKQRWKLIQSFVHLDPFGMFNGKEMFELDYNIKEKLGSEELSQQHTLAQEVLRFLQELFDASEDFKNLIKRTENLQVLVSVIFSNASNCGSKSSSFSQAQKTSPTKLEMMSPAHMKSAPLITSPFSQDNRVSTSEERESVRWLFESGTSKQILVLINGILMHNMQVSTKGVKLFEDILSMHPRLVPTAAADMYKELVTVNLLHSIRERIADVRLFVNLRTNVCALCTNLISLYTSGIIADYAVLFQFFVDLIRQLHIVESEKQQKRFSQQATPKDFGTMSAFRALNRLVILLLSDENRSEAEMEHVLDQMIERDWFVTCVNPFNADYSFFGCLVHFLLPLVVLSDSSKTREHAVTCMKLIVASSKLQLDESTPAGLEIKKGLAELLHKESHQFIAWLLQNQENALNYFKQQFGEHVLEYTSSSSLEDKRKRGIKLSMSIRKSSAGRPESKNEQYFMLRRECQQSLELLKEDQDSKIQKHREQIIIGSKFASEQWKSFKSLLYHERAVWHQNGGIKQVDFTENPHRMRKKLIDTSLEELDKLPVSQITPPTPKKSSSPLPDPEPLTPPFNKVDDQFDDVSKQQKRQSRYILDHYSKVEELLLSPNKQDRYRFDHEESTPPADFASMIGMDEEDGGVMYADDITDTQSTIMTHNDMTETGLISDTAIDDDDDASSDMDGLLEDDMDEDFKIRKHLDSNETILHTYNCLRVTGLDGQKSLFVVGMNAMYIIDNYHLTEDNEIIEIEGQTSKEVYTLHSMLDNQQAQSTTLEHKCIEIAFTNLKNVMKRRFLLRETAIEFFCHDGQNYLIVFEKSEMLKVYDAVPVNCKRIINRKILTSQWQRGEISTFDYLMKLNTLAGRSYNDLTQYPVFPWVLCDFNSEEIDLNDRSVYRDLSKPMGAISDARAKAFQERYELWDDSNIPKFHYGSHYSSAAIVLYYLIRLEPFTSQNIQLQGGKFDIADRLFFSVEDTFNSATEEHNMADVKELIPEFYYFPDFLKNRDALNLGVRSNQRRVDDVELPRWCNDDVYEFIRINRKALESDIVSEMLPAWIDLIFGYKQRGSEAQKAVNVFYYLTYEGAVDIDKIEDPVERRATIAQISNFGQTPQQLFTKPHPKKAVRKNVLSILTDDPTKISHSEYRRVPHSVGHIAQGYRELMILKPNCVLIPPKKTKYLVWNEADGSVRVYRPYPSNAISKSHEILKCVWENLHINSRATVARITEDGEYLIMGDSNGLISVWNIHGLRKTSKGIAQPQLKKRLCGHDKAVTALSVCESFSIVVSGSDDGTTIVWDLNRLSYSLTIQEPDVSAPIVAVDVNHSSGEIVTCTENTMSLWTLNGDMIARVETGRSTLTAVKLLYENEWSDNYYIITGHQSGSMRVWRVIFHGREKDKPLGGSPSKRRFTSTVIRLITEHRGHSSRLTCFFLSKDKRKLYSGDERGCVLQWSKANPVLPSFGGSALQYSEVPPTPYVSIGPKPLTESPQSQGSEDGNT